MQSRGHFGGMLLDDSVGDDRAAHPRPRTVPGRHAKVPPGKHAGAGRAVRDATWLYVGAIVLGALIAIVAFTLTAK